MKLKDSIRLDKLAMTSSLICAIHCAIVPFLILGSAFSGLQFLHNHWFEWIFIGLAVIFVLLSLIPAYKKHHKNAVPLLFASIGFLFLVLSRFTPSEMAEVVLTTMGSILITVAHYINWKLSKNRCDIH